MFSVRSLAASSTCILHIDVLLAILSAIEDVIGPTSYRICIPTSHRGVLKYTHPKIKGSDENNPHFLKLL